MFAKFSSILILLIGCSVCTVHQPVFATDPFKVAVENGTTKEPDEDPIDFWRDEYWNVYFFPNKKSCSLIVTTVKDEVLIIHYDPSVGYTSTFSNESATSLKTGDSVSLTLVFIGKNGVDIGWGIRDFDVFDLGGTVGFMSSTLGEEFGRDFSRNDFIAIFRETVGGEPILVASINLKGSAKANAKLRECAFKQSGLNPNDPFLQ